MANSEVLTQQEKAIILDALKLKAASVQRFINQQADGSPMAKAGYETAADIDRVITKVGSL